MNSIDLRTVYLNFILTDFISMVFIVLLWVQNRKRYNGLQWFALDFIAHFVCLLLIFLRGIVPDFVSIVLSNTLAVLGAFWGLIGFSRFVGYKQNYLLNYLYIPVFVLIHTYFSLYSPSLYIRNLNVSVAHLFFAFQSARVLLYKAPQNLRNITKHTGIIFSVFAGVNVLRVLAYFTFVDVNEQNYFHTGAFEVFIALIYQIIILLMCFYIVLMVNKRLIYDISVEEQKMSIAYHAVPYAILITRRLDGTIIDVNDGFLKISQYSRAEVLGKTTREMNLWANQYERNLLVEELQRNSVVHEKEFSFRVKNKGLIDGKVSSIGVVVDNQDCILSVIEDITESRNAEREIKKSRDILKKLVLNLQTAHENEKVNLATQIDGLLNQSMAALRMNIGTLKNSLSAGENHLPDALISLVDETYYQTGKTIERSLSLMNNLRNEVLYLLGFVEAVSYSIEEIEKKSNLKCIFDNSLAELKLDRNISSALFSVYQDIVNQILNKEKARNIYVKLKKNDNLLLFSISEDGNSFGDDLAANEENSLILMLRERIALFNGFFQVERIGADITLLTIEIHEYDN